LWALATLAWRLTDTGTWINQISLVAMGTSGIMTLLNFNPLIKLDGYYLLSDWLDIPNLRKKSFQYLGDSLRTLGGLVGQMPAVSRRERRIFLTYGVTAWIFSVSLLVYSVMIVGEFLIIEKQRAAFLAFMGLASLRLRISFRKLFRRSSGKTKSSVFSKRTFMWFGRTFVKLALLAIIAALLYLGRMELRVAGPVTALPHHNADVRVEVPGIVSRVLVEEGQRIQTGDVVAELLDHDVQAELEKTEARIEESGARLKLLEVGTRPEEIQLAEYLVTRAQEQLKFARDRMERHKSLYDQQLATLTEFEESARLVAAANSDLVEAKKKLVVLQAGTRPEEILAMKAMVSSLQTQKGQLERQVELLCVRSPASGVVTTPSRQLKTMEHRFVAKGDLIAKVHDLDVITAEISLSEKEIADVQIGQRVALKVRSYPERLFHGRVVNIATAAQGAALETAIGAPATSSSPADAAKSANTIVVTTEIDNEAGLLKPGMTGMAKIYCGERRLIDLVTRRISRTFRVEFWSWW
jgi:multidrug resistance efflux pump